MLKEILVSRSLTYSVAGSWCQAFMTAKIYCLKHGVYRYYKKIFYKFYVSIGEGKDAEY